MKIALASDLHLEFADINLINEEKADVLILSGDIMIAQDMHDHPDVDGSINLSNIPGLGTKQERALRFRNFLKRCSDQFTHVVYIAGNHELYHGKFEASLIHLKEECDKFSNVYFLENATKKINDYTFVGATVWTDLNKHDPLTMHAVGDMMSDYHQIRHDGQGYRKLRPTDTFDRHVRTLQYFKLILDQNPTDKFVIAGHHAPSKLSIKPKYEKDHLLNGAYSSDLSEFILDHPQIVLWTHGHTHDNFDYMIGSTRIVCNPRGYHGYEACADNFKLQYLDI